MVKSPDGARTQERLCWRGPTEIYCYTVLRLYSEILVSSVLCWQEERPMVSIRFAKYLKEF
jgi:hypothetical protein